MRPQCVLCGKYLAPCTATATGIHPKIVDATTGRVVYDHTTRTEEEGQMDADIVTPEARAILDALQPHEWYTTGREDTVVVSLDGDTALRLVVTPTPLPAESPYDDSADNRYPESLAPDRSLYVDATVAVSDARRTTTVVFGPFSGRAEAELVLTALIAREGVMGAIIRDPNA